MLLGQIGMDSLINCLRMVSCRVSSNNTYLGMYILIFIAFQVCFDLLIYEVNYAYELEK